MLNMKHESMSICGPLGASQAEDGGSIGSMGWGSWREHSLRHGASWRNMEKNERWSHKKMGKTIHKLVCEDNRLIDDASVYDPHWQFISYKWIDNLPPFWGSYNPALNKDTVPDSGGGVSAGQEKTRDKIAHIILNNERDTTVDLNLYPYLYLHNTISMSKNNVHLHVHVYISSPKKKSWGGDLFKDHDFDQ